MNSSAQLTVLVIFLARENNIKQTEGPGRKKNAETFATENHCG